jgi:hypothetical protein
MSMVTKKKSLMTLTSSALESPEHGRILTDLKHYRFGDMVRFMCDFGYVLEGNPSLLCTSAGQWNGSVPQCNCKFAFLLEQCALKNVNNCLNTNIYSYIKTSGGQSSNIYI